jgi:hypothetical protein
VIVVAVVMMGDPSHVPGQPQDIGTRRTESFLAPIPQPVYHRLLSLLLSVTITTNSVIVELVCRSMKAMCRCLECRPLNLLSARLGTALLRRDNVCSDRDVCLI